MAVHVVPEVAVRHTYLGEVAAKHMGACFDLGWPLRELGLHCLGHMSVWLEQALSLEGVGEALPESARLPNDFDLGSAAGAVHQPPYAELSQSRCPALPFPVAPPPDAVLRLCQRACRCAAIRPAVELPETAE
eukprot:CAMPEP_0181201520 /NCGR_PEP_ID=MMETSP1096-20121128/18351_1 /TAXON_ID=156174 ORGANISM="Chrysochromulina ericina, Strain CCMP281" /NCGR_SAMPLE_ID=MMETSP1096 /ASSEMBLY_ACC=CAM_ASM_000453 /LENGTH=132 /DNA_ID=CAMNT_0023291969 /DNA_START=682 /DNA_END=1081 /DNA_ORIENTATION=+